MKERIYSIWLALALSLFAISAGIAAPILSRGFYAMHIKALHLPEQTGWTAEEIQGAYDDVMNYLLKDAEFGTGVLRWSESGKAHFADVRRLFQLDLWMAGISGAVILFSLVIFRKTKPYRFAQRGPSFWAGVSVVSLFAVIGVLGAIDFDRAFTVFHSIFFPGKTNWLFDPSEDQIIQILPEAFFRDCAILAIACIFLLCMVYLFAGRKRDAD